MNTVNVHLIFLVNYTKNQAERLLPSKEYETEITDTLINL